MLDDASRCCQGYAPYHITRIKIPRWSNRLIVSILSFGRYPAFRIPSLMFYGSVANRLRGIGESRARLRRFANGVF